MVFQLLNREFFLLFYSLIVGQKEMLTLHHEKIRSNIGQDRGAQTLSKAEAGGLRFEAGRDQLYGSAAAG